MDKGTDAVDVSQTTIISISIIYCKIKDSHNYGKGVSRHFFILLLSMKYLDFDTSLLNAALLVSFFLKIGLLLLQ